MTNRAIGELQRPLPEQVGESVDDERHVAGSHRQQRQEPAGARPRLGHFPAPRLRLERTDQIPRQEAGNTQQVPINSSSSLPILH